ncbi:phosphotransferase enzyme family protein [Bradyrhizobium commune]|uniref:Phosphotransferase n=1 Tax=Bradyrhizobium commune TaxID=83627 RepID=A0A7S9D442_9BRAD|nr:phosphotransferase [Bradyrhizobium commune]QPF90845.1 phosphotransferase [Bradyrhizobium commune]
MLNQVDMEQELRATVERAISGYVAGAYNLTGSISTVVKGANWTFVVRDGSQDLAFIRLYRNWGRSVADVADEMAVLQAVEGTPALEVSRPLIDLVGRSFSTFELPDGSKRLLGVFTPAAGRELAATAADWHRAGAALSHLHRQNRLAALAPKRELLSDDRRKQTLAMIADRSQLVANEIGKSLDLLVGLGANKAIGPAGLCHGDVRPMNMRIEGERITFFDFDDCGSGPQWLDLAAMVLWLEFMNEGNAGLLWRSFLAGYGLVESESFVHSVRWMVAEHQLRIMQFLFDYCELDTALWDVVLGQAETTLRKAADGDFRAFAS